MRKIFLFCCIVFSSVASAKTYYASPSGNNSNPGTITQPWLTWSKAFQTAVAGDTVYFRGGKYPNSGGAAGETGFRSGIATDPICFINYPGEEPILDCSNKTVGQNTFFRAVSVWNVGYLYFKGLSITNVPQLLYGGSYTVTSGLDTYKSHHITYENLKISYVQGPGLGVYGCNEVYVKNCDVWEVCDSHAPNPGQNGVGFQWNSVVKFFDNTMYNTRIYFEGCRTWNFSDNGFAGPGVGYVEIKNCWAFNGAKLKGEGCGFKLNMGTYGDLVNPLCRLVVNCISAMNGGYGFSPNNYQGNTFNANIFNNTLYHNGYKGVPNMGYGFFILDYLGSTPAPNEKYCNNISFDNELGVNLVADKWTNTFNSWNTPPGATVSNADFLSLDWTEMLRPRKADGSLPDINFLKLAPGSDLIDKGTNVGLPFNGSAPDLGYSEAVTGSVTPTAPVYVSSAIENATPARIDMTYNLTLANIVPVASAFAVTVNSVARSVSSITISGTKVLLTLASPVVYSDLVKVAYTKPSTNPLQSSAGAQAVSITSQTVTNRVTAPVPVYVSSAIENATPSRIDMTYSLTLTNLVPAASAFAVTVNSVARSVSSVAISGTKVLLTLSSPVVNGNIIKVSYTKPATNPLQTSTGSQAVSITAQTVTNRVTAPVPVYVSSAIENATPSRIDMTYSLTLTNLVPAASAFAVTINSVARSVSSVAISGTKVLLTLSSPVVNGNIIKVSYTKPATNPLQSSAGAQVVSITSQTVTNKVTAPVPVYVSSATENATPSRIDMTYSLTLTNLVPAASAFAVTINSVARSVSSVAISGTKVLLTLSSPVVNGNIIKVSYTKPATNPLQSSAGAQVASITAQTVTNRVGATAPVYVGSAIENATPARIDMTYSLTLANILPATSAFAVTVNSVVRSVSSVTISGTKVLLTLASPVIYTDQVKVAYTKPSTNPLQSSAGAQVASITAQTVTNRVGATAPVYVGSAIENATPSRIDMTYSLTLANILPATSAFAVTVNFVARSVTSLNISGNKVMLTLASPVIYTDQVKVAYTKPATNPLQSSAGTQSVSIATQAVANRVAVQIPVYLSSVIENTTPSRLEMNYSLSLVNVIPAASAFTVTVNSVTRGVSSVAISGTKVLLNLSSPVVSGNTVKIAYIKPITNPLQATTGGHAGSLTAQTVTNKCAATEGIKAPIITISSPSVNSIFQAPATIAIDAIVSDPDGAISKIEFYNGMVKIGEKTTTPYSYTWNDVVEGTYSISAIATDNLNVKNVSDAVQVIVNDLITGINQPPSVNITSPGNNSSFDAPASITLEANASDFDGIISKIEYYSGTIKIGESLLSPYSIIFDCTNRGTYEISAVASDNQDAKTTSLPIIINVTGDIYPDMINLYPTPNDGRFTMEFLSPTDFSTSCFVSIINSMGKTVFRNKITGEESTIQFDVSYLPSGTYILLITSQNKSVTTRTFIKN